MPPVPRHAPVGSTPGSLAGLPGSVVGTPLGVGAVRLGSPLVDVQPDTRPPYGTLRSGTDLPPVNYKIGKHNLVAVEVGGEEFEFAERERAKEKYRRDLIRKFGMTELGAQSATEIAFQRSGRHGMSRAMSALGKVGRVLDIPSEATAGFVAGMYRNKYAKSWNPWDFVRHGHEIAASAGRGVGEYVGAGKNWGEAIKELDPEVMGAAAPFAKRHSGSVGFGMSIIADPTVYLSGGATIASKVAAREAIALAWGKASMKAETMLLAGDGVTKFGGQTFKDHLALTQAIRDAGGKFEYPQTMGDALDALKVVGLERKAKLRRFQRPETAEGELEKLGPAKIAGAYLLPQGVRGGRGIRFAGREIPGTARVTEGIGSKFRTDVEKLMSQGNPIVQAIGSGFVTQNGLRMFGEDTLRALAMTEMTSFRNLELSVKAEARAEGLTVGRAGGKKLTTPAEREGALKLKYEPAILPLQRSLQAAVDDPHVAEVIPKDVPVRGRLGMENGVNPELYDQLQSEVRTWPEAQQELLRESHVLESTLGEGGNLLTVRGPDGSLRAVGSFSDFGSGEVIHVNGVASAGGFGGAQWLRKLAQEYPDHRFELKAWNNKVYKYYKKMGAQLAPGSTAGDGADMFWSAEQVGRMAAGKHPADPYSVLRTPEGKKPPTTQVAVRTTIDEKRQEVMALGERMKIPKKDMKDDWQAIIKVVTDPVEAYAQWWFKTQMKIRSRQFLSHLYSNPMLAKKVKKNATPREGFRIVKDEATNQHYEVLAQLDTAMDELLNPVVLDKSIDHVLHALSIPQNYWKQFATSANPSFHVMNFLGAFWNNLFQGLYNPADYVRSTVALYQSRMAEAHEAGRTRYLGRATEPKSADVAAQRAKSQQLVHEARIRGATSENASIYSQFAAEAQSPAQVQRQMETLVPQLPPTVGQRVDALRRPAPGQSMKGFAVKRGRQTAAITAAATGNVPIALMLAAPEAAKIGRTAGNTIEDIVRLAPFMKASRDPVLMRYIDAFGPPRVPGMTHPGWSKEQQVAMYNIGAALSKHFQFDYSDLTVFERRMAKVFFPFYVFNKKNFLLQAQLLAQAPRGVRMATATMNYMNENGDISPEFRNLLPAYFDQIQAFQVPVPGAIREKLGLPKDQPLFLNPKLPFMSLNLFPPLWQMWQDTGTPTNQKVLGQFSSLLGMWGPFSVLGAKTVLEAAVGTSLGLNKPLDYQRAQSNSYRDSYVPAPNWVTWLPKPIQQVMGVFPYMKTVRGKEGDLLMTATGKYVLEQMATPYINNLGQSVAREGQDPGKARADMVSWMTGIRLIPVDALQIHRSYAYTMKSMLESERQALKAQGKELTIQDQNTLDMTREALKAIEEAWDRRYSELHGTPLP